MTTCRQRHEHLSVKGLIVAGGTRSGHFHEFGENMEIVFCIFCQVEHTAFAACCNLGIKRVDTVFGHFYCIIHPLAVFHATLLAISIVVCHALCTFVELSDVDCARQLGKGLAIRLALLGRGE